MESESVTLSSFSNGISKKPTTSMDHVMSSGVSQIAQSLLNTGAITTAQDNGIYQVGGTNYFSTSGITHSSNTETDIFTNQEFNKPTVPSILEDRKTTVREEETFTPLIQISISNAPIYAQQKPMFKPKPSQKPSEADAYVLVPTIAPPTKTESGTTTKKPPSTSYIYSSSPVTKKPYTTTSNKPPSTSYVYSSTSTASKRPQTTESLYTYPTTQATYRPTMHSTFANSPEAFATSSKPTRRPTITSNAPGPSFAVSSTPLLVTGSPSPPPTVIVLGPFEDSSTSSTTTTTTSYPTRRPITYATPATPIRKPVTQLTINNHITQNIYSTVRPPTPTVLITPKPGISSTYPVKRPTTEPIVAASEVQTSADDLINFPPVRNPNLNTSLAAVMDESDVTTPVFVEDQVLDQKVESFVNKIIEGLQDPFQDLKDVVYDNKTTPSKPVKKPGTTTKKPVSKPSTKPTTRRPISKPAASSATTRKPSTTTKKRPTNRRPTTTTESYIEEEEATSSAVPSGDQRTRKSFLIHKDLQDTPSSGLFSECGIRPLMKSGRIVGGKGATFGEFPWQVLVRESTWLGLFTKNKCGGVLISSRYVMTAAHCQPGFLASLVAVFGEFDISGDLESKRPVSRNVKRVIVHRQYDAATFENDLALLELEHPVQFDSHIGEYVKRRKTKRKSHSEIRNARKDLVMQTFRSVWKAVCTFIYRHGNIIIDSDFKIGIQKFDSH